MTAPNIGQEPWGEDLNAYLATLEAQIVTLEARIVALEHAPEYVYNSYAWQFSNQLPPATGSQLRLNSTTPSQATLIDLRTLDSDGADRTAVFQQLTVGDSIRIGDWNNAANIYRYRVTSPPTIGAANTTIPVSWVSGSGLVPNAKINVGFLVSITI